MDFISEFFAANPTLAMTYEITRWVVIFLDFVLLVIMIYSLRNLLKYRPKFLWDPRQWQKHLKPKKKGPELKTPIIASAWAKVQSKLKEGSADSLRLAIVEADGVVDEALKRMGLNGETFADRLSHLNPEKYSTLDKLWDAHRVRNNLVHTPDFHVPVARAEEAIAAYEAFLKDIKAL